MEFYRAGREDGGSFETGIQLALQRILASPKFVLRVERDPETVPAGTAYRISDVELASRLSFFLWSSIPDDELLTLAAKRPLREPAVLEQQVRRMLRDERSRRAGRQLRGPVAAAAQPAARDAGQRSVPASSTTTCAQAFRREVELLFDERSCARTAASSSC